MKKYLLAILIFDLLSARSIAQTDNKIENVIIITTDGFRWQEVFNGIDPVLASNRAFNQKDSAELFEKYWAATADERRKKLMPFLWNEVAVKGQVYGNRALNAKVNVANPYWFSFPGYSEIFCGFVDTTINTNAYPENPNTNLLAFLNRQKEFKDRIAAFSAWSAISNVLNEKRSGFPIVSGHEACGGSNPDAEQRMLNQIKRDAYNPFTQYEVLDVFTHYAAMDYLQKKKPRILYVAYGETDEWAHDGHYKDYLDAAHTVDKWISDLWSYIQSDKQYKDKTMLFITVDHGRGNGDQWTDHRNTVPNSYEIWFAVMGPGIKAKGEASGDIQLYQKQYAQTIAQLLGYDFKCEHPVADGFKEMLVK